MDLTILLRMNLIKAKSKPTSKANHDLNLSY